MKAPATTQKLRGGYYTPKLIADFLADWAIQTATTTILEPSYGDGNILEAAIEVLLRRGAQMTEIPSFVHGVEHDAQEARKAADRFAHLDIPKLYQLRTSDFFDYCCETLFEQTRFDAIIGNPPFIRYQHFQEEQRSIAFRLMNQAGLSPSRLTNAWVPFLVASTLLLNEQYGRIAMIIPAELLQVNYAAELRQFLIDQYSKITLITFKKLVFDGIQQEVVLFLGERNGDDRTGIRTIELDDMHELASFQYTHFSLNEIKAMDHSREKWTQYFLDQDEIDLLRLIRLNKQVTLSGKVIDVDVGVVTGLNDFFILTQQQTRDLSLGLYTQPIVTRSGHLKSIQFTLDDFIENSTNQLPSRILDAPNVPFGELPEAVKRYVAQGEANGVNTGYKCRIRARWYVVPSVWTPDAYMLRQVHSFPKIILNRTRATSTDTIHRVKFLSDLPPKEITAAFLNSLTFAFTEVVGRSYGGGVLELGRICKPSDSKAAPPLLPL